VYFLILAIRPGKISRLDETPRKKYATELLSQAQLILFVMLGNHKKIEDSSGHWTGTVIAKCNFNSPITLHFALTPRRWPNRNYEGGTEPYPQMDKDGPRHRDISRPQKPPYQSVTDSTSLGKAIFFPLLSVFDPSICG